MTFLDGSDLLAAVPVAPGGQADLSLDRAFPSSQTCSACGHRDGPKPLDVRAWTCPNRDTRNDRDWNAGRNILYEGRRTLAA
ncbi:zinc ribbon domain-containing protein [Streptomyces sp. NPDC060232]|uniref:zinc ribbon domain-containing protein n=1 Tax=Streptomyces sp. NPDC060232 TaxID=3347079 RepID=UPI0036590EEE